MEQHTVDGNVPSNVSNVVWENLEALARAEIQRFVQRLLEEEVTALVGRARSERRSGEAPETTPV